jgi:hypothetical protein
MSVKAIPAGVIAGVSVVRLVWQLGEEQAGMLQRVQDVLPDLV